MLGHEPLGVVQEVGGAVQTVRPGTRVVIPTHLFCGTRVMGSRRPVSGHGMKGRARRTAMPGWAPIEVRRQTCCACRGPTRVARALGSRGSGLGCWLAGGVRWSLVGRGSGADPGGAAS
ncbi:hypothetical protein ACLQ28_21825 [Micromonospora sp. DT201]|uniref:hypothetical protein n=1 Tax=Micromonospora sp. DT201 TaxID=3393442 RepID=UPI003CE706DE